MSSNQIPPGQSVPAPSHEVPSKHNITLGAEDTQRKSMPNPIGGQSYSQNYAIQFELKNISREVSRIAQKADRPRFYGQNSTIGSFFPNFEDQSEMNELEKNLSSMVNLKTNASTLSKYNYYGRQYRFASQNPSQVQQKPMDTHHLQENQELNSFSPTTKSKHKKQELDMPDSKSYYIYFDPPKKQREVHFEIPKNQPHRQEPQSNRSSPIKKKQSLYGSQNIPRNTFQSQKVQENDDDDDDEVRTPPLQVFSKKQPESKWVLEKKVKKLEQQLHMMKKKEVQRQKLRNFVSNNPKKDSKVFVGRQVDQLINSLWP